MSRLLLFLAVFALGSPLSTLAKASAFRPKPCDFVVQFPTTPDVRTMYPEKAASFEIAEVTTASGEMLRAECVPHEEGALDEAMLRLLARRFAAEQGLRSPEISIGSSTLGRKVMLRGSKTLIGVPATFQVECIDGKSSLMCLTTAGQTQTYPSRAVMTFKQSLAPSSSTAARARGESASGPVSSLVPFSAEDLGRDVNRARGKLWKQCADKVALQGNARYGDGRTLDYEMIELARQRIDVGYRFTLLSIVRSSSDGPLGERTKLICDVSTGGEMISLH